MKAHAILTAMALWGAITAATRGEIPASFLDKLEAERAEQSGTAIAIIFDDSGSMQGLKISQAKAAFREWISKVPANHRLGLIALNAGSLVPMGRDNRPALLAAVDKLRTGGGTPLAPNIRQALADLERRRGEIGPYERHIVLVFTDGQDTSSEGVPGVQRALEAARKQNVETVGIGFHGEGDYMRNFATRYYDAKNLTELKKSLAKVDAEIGDTSDIVLDDRTREKMKTVSSLPVSVPAKRAGSSAPQTAVTSPPSKRPNYFPWIVVIAAIIWVLIRMIKAARR